VTTATTDVRLRNPAHYLFDPAQNKMEEGTGGYFSWLGCHTIDMIFFVLQQPIVGVTAVVGRFGATETPVEDGGTAIFQMANGMLVTILGGYCKYLRGTQICRACQARRVRVRHLAGIPKRASEGGWTVRGSERWVRWEGTSLRVQGQNPQWEQLAIDETVRCVFVLVHSSDR
jgi:predicted dehydrogenase